MLCFVEREISVLSCFQVGNSNYCLQKKGYCFLEVETALKDKDMYFITLPERFILLS